MRTSLFVSAAFALALPMLPTCAVAQPRADINPGLMPESPSLQLSAAVDEVSFANVFEGLVRFARGGSVIPALAEWCEISDDVLTSTLSMGENGRTKGTDLTGVYWGD